MKKKNIILCVLILVLLVNFFPISAKSSVKSKVDMKVYNSFNETERVGVIIKLNNNSNEGLNKNNLIKSKAEDLILNLDESSRYKNYVYREISLEELNALENDDSVEKIQKSLKINAFLSEATEIVNSTMTNVLQVGGINLTGTNQTVCILDTGVNFTHPDLIGKNKSCVIDCFNKVCVENCSISDDNGHGTHVAGIVAASGEITGIAPNVSLIAVKVLDSSGYGSGNDLDLSRAIDYCSSQNVSVISMSLGTASDYNSDCSSLMSPWTDSIDDAYAKNISIIAATGNNGNYTHIASPACIGNVTAVGDTYDANVGGVTWIGTCTDSTTSADQIVCHANRNSLVRLFAPGALINSTWNDGKYSVEGGTSMATPMVAGAFAIIRQYLDLKSQTKTPKEIEAILNNTGKQIYDSLSNRNYSRIDVYAAIDSLWEIITVNLTPLNNSHINLAQQNVTFICNATDTYSLSNVTFYLWNSTQLVYNLTTNIAGINNQTNFYYNFSIEDNYLWNCIVYNNQNTASSNSNYTIVYDVTNPQITLISPENSSTWTSSSTVSFDYNVSDVSVSNCSLIINNVVDQNDSSIEVNMTKTFTQSLGNGEYNWSVNCTDSANNINDSETRKLTVSYTAPPVQESSGGSGGGITSMTYTPSVSETFSGYNKSLAKNDKIKFTFFDEETEQHTLTIDGLTSNSVNLTIQSDPIKLVLGIGQSAKLNLTNADYYNFYIKLNSITNNKADVTIQTINELIPKPGITGQVSKDENIENQEDIPTLDKSNIINYAKDVLIVMLIIAVLFILFKKDHKDRTIKEYKDRFEKHIKPRK